MCLALRRRGSLFRCTQGLALGNDERMRAPQLVSSIYCFAPAIDDTESNIGTYEPATLSRMFNGNTRAFQAATVWGLSRSNASNIIAQSLPIHVTVGDSDPLYRFEDTLLTQLDSLGIRHDALTTARGCGHDISCDINFVSGGNIDYASAHFS